MDLTSAISFLFIYIFGPTKIGPFFFSNSSGQVSVERGSARSVQYVSEL